MEIYSIIFSAIIAILLLWLIVSIFRDPKAFFIDIPIMIFENIIPFRLNKKPSKKFTKKIYTALLLFNDLGFFIINFYKILSAFRNKKISRVFMEKIMTVVTAVNGCRYCEWFHAKQAAACGISEEEIKNMLSLQFKTDASEYEIIGLLYAQHYAETNRKPDKEMTYKLVEFYGVQTANHIILMIRIIFFGNLSGNTFDAFILRFKGEKAEKINVIFEFFFALLTFPVMLPLLIVSKK